MKKVALMVFLTVAVFLPVMGGVGNQAFASPGDTLKIINNYGENITAIYCKATGANSWGNDRLNGDILYNSESFTIRSAPVTTSRYVDVKVYFSGGRYKLWESIDLKRIGRVNVN